MNKLAIGRFLNEVSEDLNALLANPAKKFLAYSGHDSTLVPVLCAFGIYDGDFLEEFNTSIINLFEKFMNSF